MDSEKMGGLIRTLRREKGLTQKQLAEQLKLTDKTISKWERGFGCPDISLLTDLSAALSVNVESILTGDCSPQDVVGGNMKQSKYYVCPSCGTISVCTGHAQLSCCGRPLEQLVAQKAEEPLQVEEIEGDWYLSSAHPMQKEHYISFVAFSTGEQIQLHKQYPEWDLQLRLPKRGHGTLFWYCTQHGLFYQYI